MTTQFDYSFNLTGTAAGAIPKVTEGVTQMTDKLRESCGVWDSLQGKIVVFNNLTQFVEKFSQAVTDTFKPGADLNAQLADLSAVSGETGEGLKTIERYARDAAKTFGGSAAQSVESYKLLLSQLSPELAKQPAALKAMGDNISILSKTMGGDATAAAEVLTTAMNQYGVSLSDPMAASRKMAEMMNIMAAAGREGSSELPTIKLALQQAGMAAKAAGVSFAETNAAIQVLDKAGKKGAEGGVALRNVMAILSTGRFLPKDVQEELAAAGVDINMLTDKSKSLTERLRPLQSVMSDSALFTKLFGRENSNAAMALVQGIGEVDRYTEAITGTNTAFEQAGIIMDTYYEKKARVQAKFDDFKISVFNATGELGIWVETVAGALTPLSQIVPLIWGVGQAMSWVRGLNWAGMWNGIQRACYAARIQTLMMLRDLKTGQIVSIGFTGNVMRASLALVRFGTVGVFNAIKGIGAYILSLVTGGTASATFSGIATASFTAFKVAAQTACRAVGVAIMNIPVIGWIIAAITAIGALFAYFWKTSAKFRATIKGIWAYTKTLFKALWDSAKQIFTAIGKLIWSALTFDFKGMKSAINSMTDGFRDAGKKAAQAYNDAYNEEMERSAEEQAAKDKKGDPLAELTGGLDGDDDPIVTRITNVGGTTDKADKIRNINISIDQLVGKFEVHTTNVSESTTAVKERIVETLLGAVNDVNYAM